MSTSRRTGACTVVELHHKSHRGTLRSPNHGIMAEAFLVDDDLCLPLDQFPWHRSRGPSPEPKFSMVIFVYGFVESTTCVHSRDSGISGICGIWMCQYIQYMPVCPKKYCKRGHLMLPSSPCLPLPHRATLRLPHLNDSRRLAPSNRHNSWDDKIWPSRSQLGFIGITV